MYASHYGYRFVLGAYIAFNRFKGMPELSFGLTFKMDVYYLLTHKLCCERLVGVCK